MTVKQFLYQYKYEILILGLFQHLFMAVILPNLPIYTAVYWPINMFILGLASYGVFHEKSKIRQRIWQLLVLVICIEPLSASFIGPSKGTMILLSLSYAAFFAFVFFELMKFLIRPGYINQDIIFASACGYLLLIEVATFLQQCIFYLDPNAYKGIDTSDPAAVYIDFVYFSSIIITSIGFGDILPNVYYTKLLVSIIGIAGQFYAVVLVGILISKFTAHSNRGA
ncbi:MAG: two pore domain potassium channel family protein [Bacteroidetes bacterium]|nr:two pore domain potassium channel family protein [Bacteroidota bacterium]